MVIGAARFACLGYDRQTPQIDLNADESASQYLADCYAKRASRSASQLSTLSSCADSARKDQFVVPTKAIDDHRANPASDENPDDPESEVFQILVQLTNNLPGACVEAKLFAKEAERL